MESIMHHPCSTLLPTHRHIHMYCMHTDPALQSLISALASELLCHAGEEVEPDCMTNKSVKMYRD